MNGELLSTSSPHQLHQTTHWQDFQRKIEQVRQSAYQELQQKTLKAKKELRKEFEAEFQGKEHVLQEEIMKLHLRISELSQKLNEKEAEIRSLTKTVQWQELDLSEFRLLYANRRPSTPPLTPQPPSKPSINLFKELSQVYLQEADQLKAKIGKFKHNATQTVWETATVDKAVFDKVNEEWAQFKKTVNLEFAARDILESRQTEFIASLQKELKEAKQALVDTKQFLESINAKRESTSPKDSHLTSQKPS